MFRPRMIALLTLALAFLGQATARAEFEKFFPPESDIKKSMKLFLDKTDSTSSLSGHVGDQNSGPVVDITANTNFKVTGSGWATIQNVNNAGAFLSATFTPEDKNLFVDFSLRGQLPKAGDVNITVTDNFGTSSSFTFAEPKNANWDRIGVIAKLGTGEFIDHIVVSTAVTDGFKELKQIAFSTAANHVVPEPSTLAIAGLGALGFIGYGLRRRFKK